MKNLRNHIEYRIGRPVESLLRDSNVMHLYCRTKDPRIRIEGRHYTLAAAIFYHFTGEFPPRRRAKCSDKACHHPNHYYGSTWKPR